MDTSDTTQPTDALATTLCPYLGRRQHRTEAYPWATSRNVCYARPRRDGHDYSPIRKTHQVHWCLRTTGGWPTCRHFLRATRDGLPTVRDIPAQAGEWVVVRTRRRRRSPRWRRWARRVGFAVALLILCFIVGMAVARMVDTVNHMFG